MNGRRHTGLALPALIFMLVVVTLLVGAMARLLSSQSATGNLNWLGTQAYWAAQSANQWAAHQIFAADACPTVPANFTINGFSISLSCTRTTYVEAGNNGALYEVQARATLGSSPAQPDYVSRSVEMVLDVY